VEHKLIQGGEQYLPFARSRIKALRASGQTYATQKFEIDGAYIEVRVVGDQEYIRITGGSCRLSMDSGCIDMINIGEANPDRYKAGERIKAGTVAAYEAAFTKPSSLGGFTNPEPTNAGQLAGVLTVGNAGNGYFRGRVPLGAPSFTPAPTPEGEEPVDDDSLWAKKVTAWYCPPSVFTGKCRLYVQAMYGLPLYETSNGVSKKVREPMAVDVGVPAIHVPAYKADGDTASYTAVPLNTSCGVYLDPDTGNHWLLRPTLEGVYIYPLISSRCGESMRKFLKGDSPLGATDKEHLEAFILAYCLPHVKLVQRSEGNLADPGMYSMGFGWHWNWSGTLAVLVKNEAFLQSGPNYAMRSSLWQLQVTKTARPEPVGGFDKEDPRFTWYIPAFDIGGGAKDWYVDRSLWVITEPVHSSLSQLKTTPRYSTPFVHAAVPFYAYYKRDDLQLCTAKTSLNPAGSRTVETSGFGMIGAQFNTVGELNGQGEIENYAEHYEAQFRFGEQQTPALYRARASTGPYAIVSEKTKTSDLSPTEGAVGYLSGNFPALASYPPYPNLDAVYGFATAGLTAAWTWAIEVGTFTRTQVGGAVIVVPAHDAEAIFCWTDDITTTTRSGTKEHQAGLNSWTYGYVFYADNDPLYEGEPLYQQWWYTFANAGLVGSGSPFFVSTEETDEVVADTATVKKLYCGAGNIDATFSSGALFYDPETEEIPEPYSARTSAGGGAAISVAHITPVGVPGDPPALPAFVGWV
jgi:hypothetical protein